MKHRGCSGGDYAGHTQSDQGAIKTNNKMIVGVNACHEFQGNSTQLHQFPETVGGDGNIRDFPGYGCTIANSDAGICFL